MRNARSGKLLLTGAIVLGYGALTSTASAGKRQRPYAKNIIFMVPDGMGLSYVTAARTYVHGPHGGVLYMERLPQIGYQRTHSANSTVTDSAAASSAWATGEKFNNGEISCHAEEDRCVAHPVTILELAKARGKATGLVVTSTITHATPAAFAAHTHSRKCQAEIGRQLVEESEVDVLLGGGIGKSEDDYRCEQYAGRDPNTIIADAQADGYAYVADRAQMNTVVEAGGEKILGLFTPEGKTPETFWIDSSQPYPEGEPTLADMTGAALDVLEENRRGFFLMIEGSQIDWAGHDNDIAYALGETIAFDEAVKTVLEWIEEKPWRKMHTLLVIVADHETGGLQINGPYGSLALAGEVIEAGWTTGDHTAQDTIIWSQGPGSSMLGKPVQNSDLFAVMKSVLR
jgi:alkaline phosphatase